MTMLFTVVIPLYNKAAYIAQTLQSVLKQSFADFEVVVVDDGSSDDGVRIVRSMGDARVRVETQANAGVAAARNRGIALARGEWVAFLDADDWWHPDYLMTQRAAIQAHPNADVVATQLRALPDGGDWSPLPWPSLSAHPAVSLVDDLPSRWMQSAPFFTSSIAVRLSCLQSMQPCFPVGESRGEDLDLWFRLGELSPIVLTEQALVAYREAASGSLTSTHAVRMLPPYLVRMQGRALDGTSSLTERQRQSALKFVAEQHITLARQALIAGRRGEALQWLRQSRGYIYSKRWYVTCLMVLMMPASMVYRWDAWRIRRSVSATH